MSALASKKSSRIGPVGVGGLRIGFLRASGAWKSILARACYIRITGPSCALAAYVI
jgi:hypothetical protein